MAPRWAALLLLSGCTLQLGDDEWARQLAAENEGLRRQLGAAADARLEAESEAGLDRALLVERLGELERENARLERLVASGCGLVALIRWLRPEELPYEQRVECAWAIRELIGADLEAGIRRELIRLFELLTAVGLEGRGARYTFHLWIQEGSRCLRTLFEAVEAGDRRASEDALARVEEVERELRRRRREIYQRNADALIARARAIMARLQHE